MDVLKTVKRGLASALALTILLALCHASPALAAKVDPSQRVYDHANIFTDREEEELRRLAREYSERLGVHFLTLAINDRSVTDATMEAYCDEFFYTNFFGVDSIYDCAIMAINMADRWVENGFYGDLRALVSQSESDKLIDGYANFLTERKYREAGKYFLDEAAKLVDGKLKENFVETPEADPNKLIYDFGGVLSGEEHAKLYDAARNIYDETNVAHVVVILERVANEQYLQRYARSFYRRNFRGKDMGVFVLAVSVDGKAAYASPYGNFTPRNDALWETNWSVGSQLRRESVFSACGYFLGMQTVDPNALLYDMDNLLSEEEHGQVTEALRELSMKTGMAHVIFLTRDAIDADRMPWFAEGFYERNLKKNSFGGFDSTVMLVFSFERRRVHIVPFGAYQEKGYKESDLTRAARDMNWRLRSHVFLNCQSFLYEMDSIWEAQHFEMPRMDLADIIHDFAGVLTTEQIDNLKDLVREIYEKHGVVLQIIYSDIKGGGARAKFKLRFILDVLPSFAVAKHGALIISAPTGAEVVDQYVDTTFKGNAIDRKIGSKSVRIMFDVQNAFRKDRDYYEASVLFINEVDKAMSSLIPNMKMVDEIRWALLVSLLSALILPLMVVLFLRFRHSSGMKRKISARNYMADGSFNLHYSRDVFLHTHTTRTRRQKASSDGGSSGRSSSSSSGGGTSTRSGRHF